jgi:hypothetical protein
MFVGRDVGVQGSPVGGMDQQPEAVECRETEEAGHGTKMETPITAATLAGTSDGSDVFYLCFLE